MICTALFLGLAVFSVPAQSPGAEAYAKQVNRNAATAYMRQGKTAAAQGDWEAAARAAEAGLAYDAGVSDLWYLKALAEQRLGAVPAKTISLFQTAFEANTWVDYTQEDARLRYADILTDTGQSSRALELLEAVPILLSQEADYIRARALYRTGDEADRLRARDSIAVARKIYPRDERFLSLFFINELVNGSDINPEVQAAAASYAADVFVSETASAELVIHAAVFAGTADRTRMLRSFNGRGLRHPLYALLALEEGLLDQTAATEYFLSFGAEPIPLPLLQVFAGRLTEETVIAGFRNFLADFEGTLIIDTDGDGITDLTAAYEFGRPSQVVYDKNQDGDPDWMVDCGFGAPQEAALTGQKLRITYGEYPSIARIESAASEASPDGQPLVIYEYAPGDLVWSPVDIAPSMDLLYSPGAYEFFIPRLAENQAVPRDSRLFAAASRVTTGIPGRQDEQIRFIVLEGNAQSAGYYRGDALYAQLFFENGIPVRRLVDETGDGRFTVAEEYRYDPDAAHRYQTEAESMDMYRMLFGAVTVSSGLYRSKISRDADGDMVAEFTEEYTGQGGKIVRWGVTADGDWNLSFSHYPEETVFKYGSSLITIQSQDGVPVRIIRDDQSYPVQKVDEWNFYWFGEKRDTLSNRLIAQALSRQEPNTSQVIMGETGRILLIRAGPYQLGELIDE